ncbi:metallophosphoesterase family protein [Pseudalkalibacillus salsuginis]|uniref:metallophosphoesterase family protein n=1 Tax=Pseudalkalibacillus salsuginis TaxID=2910972 RepID=UPI001F299193|nr:metallophosphoesterase [Pseudalkalibacillus salsuginis]MCF6411257.1 metallophosphoesterase [Pseudalkalibacillus salsuginis]
MHWSKRLFFFMLAISIIIPVTANAVEGPLNTTGKQDGGIGDTTIYLDEVPNIAIDPKVNDIIYPLFATPSIKKKGQTLTIKMDSQGKEAGNWSVKLKPTNHSAFIDSYELPIEKVSTGDSHWKESATIHDVTVKIPENTPEELYDLQVAYTANGQRKTDKQPHSVKVVEEFKKDFTFLHLTDTHIGSPRNLGDHDDPSSVDPGRLKEAGMWDPDPEKRWLYLQKAIKEVNMKNPDFVVVTGDLMYGQMNPQEYIYEYEETYKMLQKLDVPVYLVPGNHDYYAQDATLADGAKYWEQYFGPQYFSFDYGPYAHFIGYNSFDWHKFDRSGHGTVSVPTWGGQIREKQLEWVKEDLEKNAATAQAGQIKGLFSHHNPLWRDRDIWPKADPEVKEYWKQYDAQHNPQNLQTLILGEKLGIKYDQQWHGENAHELIDIMKQYNVDLSLHGHTHIDDVTQQDGILYTTTTAIELSGRPWVGFRPFQVKDGKITDYNYEEDGHSVPVYQNGDTESGIMSLESKYSNPNDGTASEQQISITNRLKKDMTVTIPIYLVKGDYDVSTGEVKQDVTSGNKQYLEVELTIPANSTKTTTAN